MTTDIYALRPMAADFMLEDLDREIEYIEMEDMEMEDIDVEEEEEFDMEAHVRNMQIERLRQYVRGEYVLEEGEILDAFDDSEEAMDIIYNGLMEGISEIKPIKSFDRYSELEAECKMETGCVPYTGCGINYRKKEKTTILKSADGVEFYADDLDGGDILYYTLYGWDGDQDENDKYNEPLLNPAKTSHIYLYRVMTNNKKKTWVWYGKCEIVDRFTKTHPGSDLIPRQIIVLALRRI